MAYTLYITRPPHFRSATRRKIAAAAFSALITGDPALQGLDPTTDGPAVRFRPSAEEPAALFLYRDGNILCKNPDEPAVAKMLALAAALDAQVQGEDGEVYTSATESPHLVQFMLFDRVSQRLRVRFPTMPRRSTNIAALVPTPVFMRVGASTAPSAAASAPESPTFVAVPTRMGRMKVGFPTGMPQPSPALQSLLNPLQPAP